MLCACLIPVFPLGHGIRGQIRHSQKLNSPQGPISSTFASAVCKHSKICECHKFLHRVANKCFKKFAPDRFGHSYTESISNGPFGSMLQGPTPVSRPGAPNQLCCPKSVAQTKNCIFISDLPSTNVRYQIVSHLCMVCEGQASKSLSHQDGWATVVKEVFKML